MAKQIKREFSLPEFLDRSIKAKYPGDTVYRSMFVGDGMKDSIVYYPRYTKDLEGESYTGVQLFFVDDKLKFTELHSIWGFNKSGDILYYEEIFGKCSIDDLKKKVNNAAETNHKKANEENREQVS